MDLLIWVHVKCERDCGLQRWGHWNVGLGDNFESFWQICRPARQTVMMALGRKGSGGNYWVRHFTRQFCTECQSKQQFSVRGGQTNSNKIYFKKENCETKGQIRNCHIELLVTWYCQNDSFIRVQLQSGRCVLSTLPQMLWNIFL